MVNALRSLQERIRVLELEKQKSIKKIQELEQLIDQMKLELQKRIAESPKRPMPAIDDNLQKLRENFL